MIRKIAITSGLALGVLLSAIFERNVSGRHYFSLSFACALSLYWMIELILTYIAFRKTYEKRFQFYKAKLVNNSNLTLEQIESQKKVYYKKFKRSMLKESFLGIFWILAALGLALAFFVTMFV